MPKYYCDYCDIYLTHDSISVRNSHNSGWKHKQAVRDYYQQYEEDHNQNMMSFKMNFHDAAARVASSMSILLR
jgi:hypothetical protein